jgi:hypothetical protein
MVSEKHFNPKSAFFKKNTKMDSWNIEIIACLLDCKAFL